MNIRPRVLLLACIVLGLAGAEATRRGDAGQARAHGISASADANEALDQTSTRATFIASVEPPRRARTGARVEEARNPVYIVTSRATFDGIRDIARNGVERRDHGGNRLVVSRIDAQRLGEVSDYIHQREQRCGGFFAFASRGEADDAIRADQSVEAMQASMATAYAVESNPMVEAWMAQVGEQNIRVTISDLSSFQNRYYASASGKAAAEWIRDRWQALAGLRMDTSVELFTACSVCSTQPSVIMTVQARQLPDEIVVVGAHLDSINGSAGGSLSQVAPGADDDASGIATLTEVIRVALASGWRPRRTVMFMGYAAEEVGLRGSRAIAQSFRAQNRNVVGVLQLDMTNYKAGAVADMRLVTDFSNADLQAFVGTVFDRYLAPQGYYRGLYTCGYGCSDHASWTSAGYPAAMMFEAGNGTGYFPYIHTTADVLANMGNSAEHSVKFAKLALAFVGDLAGSSQPRADCNLPPEQLGGSVSP